MTKYQQYRKLWADTAKNLKALSVPIHIDLELSKICNLRCAMCPISARNDGGIMDYDLAKSILNDAARIGVQSIKMNWRGEPTLHPDFVKISQLAHSLGFVDIMLNTNGMYDTQHIRYALNNYYRTIIFSIDAFDNNIFCQCREGSNPDLIFSNLCYAVEMRKHIINGFESNFIVMNHVRQEANWNEYEILKKMCERSNIKFRAMLAFPRTGIKLHSKENMPKIIGRKSCSFPFQRLTIGYDGNIYPCCCIWDNDERLLLGNIKTDSLQEIWNGKRIKELRQQEINNKKVNPICKTKCISWITYETDKTTLFDRYEK